VSYAIYGANGYTGQLIAKLAVEKGHHPILAGRSAGPVRALADSLQLPHRVFALDSIQSVDQGLAGVSLILNCAGPFSRTARALVDGCLRHRVHYLDISGEVEVFEACAARGARARAGGVLLLPGVGFDVVPSDCLAAHLKARLPSATHLALAFLAGRLSRGTATTMVENIHRGGLVRRQGKLSKVPAAWKSRVIDLGRGPVKAVTIPWGDISTAFYSTSIPNIEVYLAAPWSTRVGMKLTRWLGPLLSRGPVQEFLKKRIAAGPAGPTDEQRARGSSLLWGEVTDETGGRAVTRMQAPEGYTLTAMAAVAIVERVLHGAPPIGYQTPSTALGADFVLELEGVLRTDEPA
jgi:short subunit dehydrogenase-like uncharacterized protein